jgi:hypothetical protein
MKRINYVLMLMISIMGCKKPYNPSVIANNTGYLVVEGVINSGTDSTFIKLSKTGNLSGVATANPVLQASVTVESDQNNNYPLTELGNGKYGAAGLNLNSIHNYRLNIQTADGQQYQSDFEPVIITPPIDSVGFTVQANGLQLYVNTHDPNNKINYYRWDYKETWQFHAEYESEFVSNGTAIVYRPPAQGIYGCFGNDTSSTIVIGSSAKLKQAVIYQNPLTQIASTSEKIETKYSILVNQYALTGDAYNFWVNLKLNTEQLGSIFDPQPSANNGNMHCVTNPSEPVIGYISVCTVQQKRIFISNAQLPQTWVPTYPYSCTLNTALYCAGAGCTNQVAIYLIPPGSADIPITSVTDGPAILGFTNSSAECVDCTIRGTTTPPAFWK